MDFTLITGASGGIGLELARLCAADGRNLILVARSAGKLQAVKEELEGKYPIHVEVLTADLSRVDAAKELHEKTTGAGYFTAVNEILQAKGLTARGINPEPYRWYSVQTGLFAE